MVERENEEEEVVVVASLERKEETEVWIGGAFRLELEEEVVDEVRSCDAPSTDPLASRRSSNAIGRVRFG